MDAAVQNAVRTVGSAEHRQIERGIAEACVKLAYEDSFEPFAPRAGERIAVLMPYESEINSVQYALKRMEREVVLAARDVRYYCCNGQAAPDASMLKALSEATYLFIGSEQTGRTLSRPDRRLNTAVGGMLEHVGDGRVTILCMGLPYQAEKYAERYPCVFLYNYSDMSREDIDADRFSGKYEPAIPAGIELLFGAISPRQQYE